MLLLPLSMCEYKIKRARRFSARFFALLLRQQSVYNSMCPAKLQSTKILLRSRRQVAEVGSALLRVTNAPLKSPLPAYTVGRRRRRRLSTRRRNGLSFSVAAFTRVAVELMRKIAIEKKKTVPFRKSAVLMLQRVTEAFLQGYMCDAALLARHAGRSTVQRHDLLLVQLMRRPLFL